MTNSEKWAWWTLGVVALTISAYFVLIVVRGNGPPTLAAFALLALTASPKSSRRYFTAHRFDEREKEISRRALLAGFRALWLVAIMLAVALGCFKGWDTTLSLPLWKLSEAPLGAFVLVLAVESATTLVLFRKAIDG